MIENLKDRVLLQQVPHRYSRVVRLLSAGSSLPSLIRLLCHAGDSMVCVLESCGQDGRIKDGSHFRRSFQAKSRIVHCIKNFNFHKAFYMCYRLTCYRDSCCHFSPEACSFSLLLAPVIAWPIFPLGTSLVKHN